MRDKLVCDILVVGAGPAGARAARSAAEAGCNTLLIDAKPRIGEQPHCGEFVPTRLFTEFDLNRDCIQQKVDFMETRILGLSASPAYLNPDKAVLRCTRIPSPGYIIDRVRFDRDLAREAASKGATVMCATRLLRREGRSWIVRCEGKEVLVKSALTIAADGPASSVAATLGMKRPDLLQGLQAEVPLTTSLDGTFIFLDKDFVGGYGWLFPKGTTANVGIGIVPGLGASGSQALQKFLERLRENGFVKPGRLALAAGVIPVSGLRENLVAGGVIFCGDAAGLTHPITGAGIPQAVLSGYLAGRAAAEALRTDSSQSLVGYENEIRAIYNGIINHALSKRALMMQHWNELDFESICEETWIGFKGYKKRIRSAKE
ncbi:MAG TPA: geranylgeranyl reductase family protein [Desulfomonilaceae bacterium]|nr:geranylgeranyl reductase family protein [Desulfomonilaceae bacterium]